MQPEVDNSVRDILAKKAEPTVQDQVIITTTTKDDLNLIVLACQPISTTRAIARFMNV